MEFHLKAVREMLRVAGEVRIFPLLSLHGRSSPIARKVEDYYSTKRYCIQTPAVPCEFQRGSNRTMVVRSEVELRSDKVPSGARLSRTVQEFACGTILM
jgi:hypothetical protein